MLLLGILLSPAPVPPAHALALPGPVNSTPSATPQSIDALQLGTWRAWLDCPGGELPFGLDLARDDDGQLRADLINGEERIRVPSVSLSDADGPGFELLFPHYDARVTAQLSEHGTRLDGEYVKRLGQERWRRLPFHASLGSARESAAKTPSRFGDRLQPAGTIRGRWRIEFESSDDSAVGIFAQTEDGSVTGTILTTTGDYRFLEGALDADRLRLSVFDGAHSFLFDAILQADGSLKGDFWSGDSWHEGWTAQRDEKASLADPFQATRWHDLASLADVLLPDSHGVLRSLTEPELRGQATLVVLFGSWCPNCHDEAPYLVELMERYGPKGLRVVGLAFEFTGDSERDRLQLRRFAERYGIEYPLLLAGTADKADATLAFPGLDFVRSYPTTLFVDNGGHVRWVHSGFAGPATGQANSELRRDFEQRIEALLQEPTESHVNLTSILTATAWRTDQLGENSTVVFSPLPGGQLSAHVVAEAKPDTAEKRSVRLVGADAVWIADDLYRFDATARALLSPTSFGQRLMPANELDSAILVAAGYPGIREVPQALLSENARVRREAVWALGRRRMRAAGSPADEFLPLLADPEVEVAIAATWAVAATGDLSAAETLGALRAHPNARMRREVARGLRRLARMQPALMAELEPLRNDPDPLVRAIVAGD